MIFMQAPHQSNPMQIRKLIVSPENWDGDIWGDPDDIMMREMITPCSPQITLNMRLDLSLKQNTF